MSLIAISRGTFSGGKKLAEALAHALNYPCIDRDAVVEKASIRNTAPQELQAALDLPPSSDLCTLNHKKYLYLTLLKTEIAEEARTGNAVYHGLVGHRLFPHNLPVLGIRVIAPMEYRIREAQQRLSLNREEVIAYIEKMDNHRSKWTRYLYGVNWENPALYDLVINLQFISIDHASRMIVHLIQQGEFQFSNDHQAVMKDFQLATRVSAALARDCMTTHLEVVVEARQGHVTIKGDLYDQSDHVERVVTAVPGVISVRLQEITVAPPN